ncbi:MAG TPA: ABC transporter substrate-binding protein [Methanoregula sp.]|nr:ABC transporter substrate-binding protein [Methanoregula sp.]
MKRIITCLFLTVLILAAFFSGCTGQNRQEPASPAAPGTAEKSYIVGIDAEYPPYSYLDPNGTPTGFDVESMRWIAEKKGLSVTFQPTAWDGMIPSMDAGKIDMVYSGMTITPERAEKVNFSIPYLKINQSVAVPDSTTKTPEDFYAGHMIVGAQRGTTGAIWVENNLVNKGIMSRDNLKLYDSFPLVAADLAIGRIDAAVYDKPPMITAIADKPAHIIGEIDTNEQYGVAIPKSNPVLLQTMNDGLAELMKDPYWQVLRTRYDLG